MLFKGRLSLVASPDLILYYFVQLGLCLQGLICHAFFERPLKDYWVMVSHHVATLGLIMCSYGWGHMRIGAIIMWLHDCSDPFLNVGKLIRYCGSEVLSGVFLIFLIVSWAMMRLYYFMKHCIIAVIIYLPKDADYVPLHRTFALPLLLFLYALHWYWFYLMFFIIYRKLIKGEEIDDPRSDHE